MVLRRQQAGGIKSQGTLWMVTDHQALAPLRFFHLHQVSDYLRMHTQERVVEYSDVRPQGSHIAPVYSNCPMTFGELEKFFLDVDDTLHRRGAPSLCHLLFYSVNQTATCGMWLHAGGSKH